MTVVAGELKGYKSSVITDTGTNGGRMSSTEIVSGVSNNVFPNVFTADRVAGLTTHRKTFWKVGNDADESLFYPQLWLDIITAGDDWVSYFVGTQRDIQSGIAGTEQKYGVGTLYANVSAAATTITVDTEDATLVTAGNEAIFLAGMKIRITDKDTIIGTGNEEILTIASGGVSAPTGTRLTLTVTTGLVNGYLIADDARVMSVYEPSTVACSTDNWVENGSGTYDEADYYTNDNIGTVEETWTLTFSSATEFGVVGDTIGSVGTGDVTTEFAPSNADFSKPYFTLDEDGWGGTWTTADTIVWQSHPAAVPIWQKRVVPAGCGSLSGNKTTMVFGGES